MSADRWAVWVMEITAAIRAKHERHERRTARILAALREAAPTTMDEEEVFL